MAATRCTASRRGRRRFPGRTFKTSGSLSVDGLGEQELEWGATTGRWSVVVMNVDGSSDVAADLEIGLRSGVVMPIVIAMIVAGVLGLAGGVVLIVVGARGRRSSDLPGPTSGVPLGAARSRNRRHRR